MKNKKVIRLTEGDLNRIVKKVLIESTMAPEPVVSGSYTVRIYFPNEGQTKISDGLQKQISNSIVPRLKKSKSTIEKFYNNEDFDLPKFIRIGARTTSGGDYKANKKVAEERIVNVKNFIIRLLESMGYNAEQIERFITTNTDYTYEPTEIDANLYDRNMVKPKDSERYVYISISELTTKGLNTQQVGKVEDMLRIARGWNINPDEVGIAKGICNLQTYSDIEDLDYELRDFGGLEKFINDTITWGYTSWDDDSEERRQILNCLNKAAKTSGKGKIAKIVSDKIAIIFN